MDQRTVDPTPSEREEYSAPEIKDWGTVADLTQWFRRDDKKDGSVGSFGWW